MSSPESPVLSPEAENALLGIRDDNTVQSTSTCSDDFLDKMDVSLSDDSPNKSPTNWLDQGQKNVDRRNQQSFKMISRIKVLVAEKKRLRREVSTVRLFS